MKRTDQSRRRGGFTLFEAIIMSVILAVLIAVLMPALMASRKRGSHINCANSVKQIGLSFRQWAMDHSDKYPMQVSVKDGGTMDLVSSKAVYPHFQVMSNELNTPLLLICPGDSKAAAALAQARGSNALSFDRFPTNFPISYFVGMDAQPDRPKILLSGDANLTVGGKPAKPGLLSLWTNSPIAWTKPLRPYHGDGGNILLADGQVHQVGNASLRQVLQESGVATNRLAMP